MSLGVLPPAGQSIPPSELLAGVNDRAAWARLCQVA